ncbi:MAG: cytochrome-c peroxidase [Armatimonadetes bacterium]|nr:cytochrome-c peroxidase [Armatimonadota bacterium]
MRPALIWSFILTAALVAPNDSSAQGQFYANGLLPQVPVPFDNPQTDAKIRLGEQLYFDGRLSSDGTISCASCHRPDKGWADTEPVSEGVAHKKGGRNSPTIINAAYTIPQFWDGRALHLEKQAVGPVQNPIEMDLTVQELEFRLNHIPGYVRQFRDVFGAKPNIDLLAKAIASFERTIISNDSPYDRYIQGDRCAMTKEAVEGMEIFNGKGHCTVCHSGPNFTDSRFHNLGVGYDPTCKTFADVGRYAVTKNCRDMGAFKTPGLRDVACTPPYLHDGSECTLMDVINLYDRGGNPNPYLDPAMLPLGLSEMEKCALVEYLKALSGPYPVMKPPPLPNPKITAQRLAVMFKAEGGCPQ